jgi:hypothetical protein
MGLRGTSRITVATGKNEKTGKDCRAYRSKKERIRHLACRPGRAVIGRAAGPSSEVGMSAKHVLAGVLLVSLAGACAANAQPVSPYGPYTLPGTATPNGASAIAGASSTPVLPASTPSSVIVNGLEPVSPSAQAWQQSGPCYCCGPVGGDGPIGEEIFLYGGPTLPSSGGVLFDQLRTGWMAEWGGRTLFFNTQRDAAWTAKISVTYAYNRGLTGATPFSFFGLPVRVHDLDRWSFTWGAGRDWFLIGRRDSGSSNLRFGLETGGRYGTEHVNLILNIVDPLNLNNYLRRQDIFGAYFLGAHIDYEVPMGGWVWMIGFRAEHTWNFADILPGQDSSLRDVNLLISTGFRF